MKALRSIGALIVLFILVCSLNAKLGPLPPLGKFFSPIQGFWQNAERHDQGFPSQLKVAGLHHAVTVYFDSLAIPHILASDEHDLYLAQGYVTAKDRLWQMETQTRAASGRLSEVLGANLLAYDRYQRRLGMVAAAEQSLAGMMADPQTKTIVTAYTEGINAYIVQLNAASYPLEYKLLDYAPENWKPLKCALLLKSMAQTLSAETHANEMSNILAKFGPYITNNLFPDYPAQEDPIIPSGTKWDFQPLSLPMKPAMVAPLPLELAKRPTETGVHRFEGIGSNNWAIAGSKTESGYPILENDPHLDLSLPSLWYQIQLTAPGINVCGVSLPGAPGVISGFNNHIAWGVTNTAAAVMDVYHIHFEDAGKKRYLYDGHYVNLTRRIEHIRVRGGKDVYDTVWLTIHGPLVTTGNSNRNSRLFPAYDAIKWSAYARSNELKTFYLLNTARGYEDYVNALSFYSDPAQNFAYADDQKNIALWVNGKFPLKWKEQGKYVLDGADPKNEWQGWVPFLHNPHVKNPERGFVSSANQSSTDTTYPYYINWKFAASDRGARINQLLKPMRKANLDTLAKMQNDVYNLHALTVLPNLLASVDARNLEAVQGSALALLRQWDYQEGPDQVAPSIFDRWNDYLHDDIWDEFQGLSGPGSLLPSEDRTTQLLLHEPTSKWFDNVSTKEIETKSMIATRSFKRAVDTLIKKYGRKTEDWKWYSVKNSSILHLLKINAFSRLRLHTGGGRGVINALSETHGPSWKMVVQLGASPHAFGVYPGGQSGNPGSRFYDNMIPIYEQGKLYPITFLQGSLPTGAGISVTHLTPN